MPITTFDLSTLNLLAGTHSITVKARASGYEDSDESNAVSYVVESEAEGSEGLAYTLSDDGTYYICSGIGTCTDTDIVIAGEYKGLPVKEIGYRSFYEVNSITSIVIPNSIEIIDDSAFSRCSITSIVIPDSVTSIGDGVFYRCDSLTDIEVDEDNEYYKDINGNLYTKDGKTLIQYAIGKTDTSFTVPYGVETIGISAFYYCSNLTSVEMPDTVTSIAGTAFYRSDITSVVIPDSVTTIGNSAFRFSGITSVTVPSKVRKLEAYVFDNCYKLSSVVVGINVTSIGSYAVSTCPSLTSIEYRGTKSQWIRISKDATWHYDIPVTYVTCTDGTVAI